MSYLLDTNILSELARPKPDPGVLNWVLTHADPLYHLSVVSLSELQFGISRLLPGQRRDRMQAWLAHDLSLRFAGRCLGVDEAVALRCGQLRADRQTRGAPLHVADGLIAATAAIHGLVLVTRNIRDFVGLDLQLLNPFSV